MVFYILKESHAQYFSSIITIMAAKKANGRVANVSADEVIHESGLLRAEFQSLIALLYWVKIQKLFVILSNRMVLISMSKTPMERMQ